MSPNPPPPQPDDAAATRAASLWPDSQAVASVALTSSSFHASRFDPLFDQRRRARQRLGSHFDLCRPALALRVLLSMQALVLLLGVALSSGPGAWMSQAAVPGFAALAACLLWLPAVCALRGWLPLRGQATQWGVVSALGATGGLGGWALVLPLGLAQGGAWQGLGVALLGATAGAATWLWLWLRARASEPVEAGARLAELQSRIRPHFLFNALNTALALVRADPPRAERVLEDLAQLFRFALAETSAAVSLDQEVDLARRYLAIEQVRFGSRLQLSWELDPAAASARVPPLVLQPLVENAVRHGIEPALGGGRIVVHSLVRRGMATLWVTNTLAEGAPAYAGAGMALANVRERLRLLHDVAGALEVWREPGLFHARITVPAS